ncbi:MAG: transporter substrate-binding domain-containing protein [Rubrivivax sp.]|nr:MAG: transporter substrate-binding domain-containing protein [Rubrivivax sp.]
MFHRLLLAGLLMAASLSASAAPLVVTLREPESDTDPRPAYDHAVIRLALDKTVATHGPYTLQFAPPMNAQRALLSAEQKRYPGFLIVSMSRSERTAAGLVPVRFPYHLGAAGTRVCFVSPKAEEAVARARTLDDLRRFSIVQGAGWTDGAILRANGFRVEEVSRYEAMFSMVAQGRVDLFCRSVLEVSKEVETHAKLPGLRLDTSFALVYDLPQFFYTHRDNQELVQRLTQGLEAAYADGSLLALFRTHMRASIRFADLPKRRLFKLAAPPIADVGFDYRRYNVDLARDLQ